MVSFTIDKGNVEKLAVFGDLETTVTEVTCMLYVIYKVIEKKSEGAAEAFKEFIESAIEEGIVFCDNDEHEKIIEEKKKEKNLTKEIEQILQELKRKK